MVLFFVDIDIDDEINAHRQCVCLEHVHGCMRECARVYDSQIAHGDTGGRLVGHLLLILRIWATMQTMRRNVI